MTGEIDTVILSLFSLREKLSELESKIELYSSQQMLVSLMMSLGVVVGFKVYDYLYFNSHEIEEEHSYDEYSDEDSVFEEEPEFHNEKPIHSGCGSDSSGLDEYEKRHLDN